MKILVFIEHDIIIRHFIFSGVFKELIKTHDLKFVFPEPDNKRVKTNIDSIAIGAPSIRLPVHIGRYKLWKRRFQVGLLRLNFGSQQRNLRVLHREMIGWKSSLVFTLLGLPGIFKIFCWHSNKKIQSSPYTGMVSLFQEFKPDLVIHPTVLDGLYINDLVYYSKKNGVPLVAIMNSWDNPSTKHSVFGNPDWLLVWGKQTKQHAQKFMGMSEDRIIEFGAAQFDVYRSKPRVSRDEFCQNHGVDVTKTLLLYAGSSKGTDEMSHLLMLERAINMGLMKNVAVIYRPHPWGDGGMGGERIYGYDWKHIKIENTMGEYLKAVSSGTGGMSLPDYRDTHDVLSSVDVVVSPLSTILIEGALHGKRVLCFLPVEEKKGRHFQLVAPLTHFEDFFRESVFFVARGKQEFLPKILKTIESLGDDKFYENLNEINDFYVKTFDTGYGRRLLQFCSDVVEQGSHSKRSGSQGI